MLSIRKIRRKIRSVNNIKKITRAMEMVSAAKLRRVQDRLVATRPYVNKLQAVVHNLVASLDTDLIKHPFMSLTNKDTNVEANKTNVVSGPADKSIMAIVIAGDKGLCGGYNTNLIRTAIQFINQPQWSTLKMITLGRKATDYFTKHPLAKVEVIATHTKLPIDFDLKQIQDIGQSFTRAYLDKTVSAVWLIYTEYVNALVYKTKVTQLLPIPIGVSQTGALRDPDVSSQKETPFGIGITGKKDDSQEIPATKDLPYGYLYEPKPELILELLLPKYLDLLFYRLILEALASEQSARMMAMRNATENAKEVIDELTLTFNKARQAGITKELLDIVGGVEAMKG